MRLNRLFALVAILIINFTLTGPVKASEVKIPKLIYETAKRNKIPIIYFYALAAKESSAKFKDGSRKPWAYTINHDGSPYYFANKKSMMKKANELISNKQMSFDIGWYQVNWRWHKSRVPSIYHLAEPKINAQVAADIYLEQYKKHKDWNVAAGRYHNPNNNHGYADAYEKSFREYVALIRKGRY